MPSDPASIEWRLQRLLGDPSPLRLAVAESLTGGGVAARITRIAGSSAYLQGGIVAYANEAKAQLLGVPAEVLRTQGAVSAACAEAMVAGALRAFAADVAVATTGIAGPGGATARKPRGLVYLAAGRAGRVRVEEHVFPGDRAAVTAAATERALAMLFDAVEEALAGRDAGR
jgi:PncC family amidohydrolase